MHRLRRHSYKKLALLLALLLLTGCNIQAEKATNETEAHANTSPNQPEEKQSLDNNKKEIGNLKISLHTKLLEFLDTVTANEAFAYLNNNSGQVEALIITKHHPEIFSHQNKDNYVLCVSAKNNEGNTYAVDIYNKQWIDTELTV